MAETAQNTPKAGDFNSKSGPRVKITVPAKHMDYATFFGLFAALGLIVSALFLGGSPGAFLDLRSFLVVFCGTLAVTFISFTGKDFLTTLKTIGTTFSKQDLRPSRLAKELMNVALLARKEGILALERESRELRKDEFLYQGVQMVNDGHNAEEINHIMSQEIATIMTRYQKAVGTLRRAAEAAPAMGLIGTLIGWVQMLALLDDPASIGPSMALALLTTFYGAMLGTVIFAPMAAKLEENAQQEALKKQLVLVTINSIVRQENPRRLEMVLNSELPPIERIKYYN